MTQHTYKTIAMAYGVTTRTAKRWVTQARDKYGDRVTGQMEGKTRFFSSEEYELICEFTPSTPKPDLIEADLLDDEAGGSVGISTLSLVPVNAPTANRAALATFDRNANLADISALRDLQVISAQQANEAMQSLSAALAQQVVATMQHTAAVISSNSLQTLSREINEQIIKP